MKVAIIKKQLRYIGMLQEYFGKKNNLTKVSNYIKMLLH